MEKVIQLLYIVTIAEQRNWKYVRREVNIF